MCRFTIRDLLWTMLLVGFGLHTWMDRCQWAARERRLRELRTEALVERDQAKAQRDQNQAGEAERTEQLRERTARYVEIFRQVQLERVEAMRGDYTPPDPSASPTDYEPDLPE